VRKVAQDRVGDVQDRSQDLLDQQREKLNAAVEAGKSVVRRRQANNN